MRRRNFIFGTGIATLAWSLAAHAQQVARVRRIGVLMSFPENEPRTQAYVQAFVRALGRFGWVADRNVRIDYRFAAGNPALFKTYAAELVSAAPDVILASTAPSLVALKALTKTIPIVFVIVPDPVGLGFVESVARPGGNITGFMSYDALIIGKWLQLLKEMAPAVKRVAVIFNPDTAFIPPLDSAIAAARSLGVAMTRAPVHNNAEIEEAITVEAREPGGALIEMPDSFNVTHRDVIIDAAVSHSLPVVGFRTPRAGELMSYLFDIADQHAQAASYVDRILRGTSPAELPIQRPTKFSLVVNLKTAKALGLNIPPAILSITDRVIE
jgi:putative tryptophan/tyrosine transport system substrate-binding protein